MSTPDIEIVIQGPKGCGKSRTSAHVSKWLHDQGFSVRELDDDGRQEAFYITAPDKGRAPSALVRTEEKDLAEPERSFPWIEQAIDELTRLAGDPQERERLSALITNLKQLRRFRFSPTCPNCRCSNAYLANWCEGGWNVRCPDCGIEDGEMSKTNPIDALLSWHHLQRRNGIGHKWRED